MQLSTITIIYVDPWTFSFAHDHLLACWIWKNLGIYNSAIRKRAEAVLVLPQSDSFIAG